MCATPIGDKFRRRQQEKIEGNRNAPDFIMAEAVAPPAARAATQAQAIQRLGTSQLRVRSSNLNIT